MDKNGYDDLAGAKKILGFIMPILIGVILNKLFKKSDYIFFVIFGISSLLMIISFLSGEKYIAIGVLSFYIFVGIIVLTLIGLCKFGSGGGW